MEQKKQPALWWRVVLVALLLFFYLPYIGYPIFFIIGFGPPIGNPPAYFGLLSCFGVLILAIVARLFWPWIHHNQPD